MHLLKKGFMDKKAMDDDYFRLKPKRCGIHNKDKTIYVICEDNENLGFFAMYRYWLEYLYFADICGYSPVVSAGHGFAYGEPEFMGKRDPFEYYFEQPVGIALHQARKSSKVIASDIRHRQMIELVYTGKYADYRYTQKYLKVMGDIVRKYMRFNNSSWRYICSGLDKLQIEESRVLGVHIRGTDFKSRFDNHPICLEPADFFPVIDALLSGAGYNKIFLATDDKGFLEQFLEKYGNKICYYRDVFRNNRNRSVAFEKSTRQKHKYRLGLEVLRDMYTLAACDGLTAGVSQVAVCAQINKLAMGKQYRDLKIIDKGICRNHRGFRKR